MQLTVMDNSIGVAAVLSENVCNCTLSVLISLFVSLAI